MYAKSHLAEFLAKSLVGMEDVVLTQDMSLRIENVKRILAQNLLREEYPRLQSDGQPSSFSWMVHRLKWRAEQTEILPAAIDCSL